MRKCVTMKWKQLDALVRALIKDKRVSFLGPVEENDSFAFREIETLEEVRLDYDRSYFSPIKEYLLPRCEVIARFDCGHYHPITNADKKTVLFGVHPYDIKAMDVLDAVYLNGKMPDPGYMKRRKNLTIIGLDIFKPPKNSFCESVGAHVVDHGFDLMLTCIRKKIIVEIGSDKGESLLAKYFSRIPESTTEELILRDISRLLRSREYPNTLPAVKENLAALLDTEKGKAFLTESAKKCIACGNCTKVCPTCMCYAAHDTAELDGTSERVRTRSSCLFGCSAKIAGGHDFRENPEDRIKNRLLDKVLFVPREHGVFGCVGCGRCGICPVGIAHLASAFSSISDSEKK